MPVKIRDISYKDIEDSVDAVHQKVADYDCILGIVRGGAIPATLLAHKLKTKNMQFIQISSYASDNRQGNLIETAPLNITSIMNKKVVVVDDISDSGMTLDYIDRIYRRYTDKMFYFTVISKKKTVFNPDYSHIIAEPDEWVKFPWE